MSENESKVEGNHCSALWEKHFWDCAGGGEAPGEELGQGRP